ncbi:ribonucleoside-diphosphate reductase [Mimivirus AB-566-O17]|uniref:ribonucleoside-diphosphate reductase n=1 Tax=Mimivirus AB-566-O17 TaxID=1988039 RepID=A0A1X9VNX2_9VIRU|nr:ribonucleoside-diphosphate reductase [Mimivirus AB-566-O17]
MGLNEEFIKSDQSERYTVYPLQYPDLYDFYEKHVAVFWTKADINISDDLSDWAKLNDNERYFLKNVFAFFASSDGIVNENLLMNFANEIEITEARQFYAIQIFMESVHNEVYSQIIDSYCDSEEKDHLFKAIETVPAVKQKADWALKWINESSTVVNQIPKDTIKVITDLYNSSTVSDQQKAALEWVVQDRAPFAQRLLAFICVEGVFFSGSFCAIGWMKNRGKLNALGTANQFISRDENLHCEFAIALYNKLPERLPEATVHSIMREAVDIETVFITESLPVSLLGMNSGLMVEYIKYIADAWLSKLNYSSMYNVKKCPFGFMELLELPTKENFFEGKVSNYNKAGVGVDEDHKLEFDADF